MVYKVFTIGMALFALWCGLHALSVVLIKVPRLEGLGCQNASGPLYANEEDSFPPCDDIHSFKRGFLQ